MKTRRTLGTVLGALLVPALCFAQSQPDQTYPQPQPPQPPQQNPAPVTVNTDGQPQQPAQPNATSNSPVVVVNPNEPPPVEPTVVPANPEEQTEPDMWNAPVFGTGAVVFGGSYIASVIDAGTSDHVGANRLYVPIVGPWLALNDWGNCPIEQPSCDQSTTDKVLLIADGVFQAAGVLTMLDGVLEPTRHVVAVQTAQKGVHVAPTGNGVLVFGHF